MSIYSGNLTYNDDGTVWKKPEWYSKYKTIFPILEKYELDFIPKILEWNDEGYRYEYIDEMTLQYSMNHDMYVTQKNILEMKMAMDDIWKKLYQISIENLKEGHFLWHDDPHVKNVIWKDDKLILLDIDSFCISKHVPICYLNNKLFGELEEYSRKKIMNEGALFGNEY